MGGAVSSDKEVRHIMRAMPVIDMQCTMLINKSMLRQQHYREQRSESKTNLSLAVNNYFGLLSALQANI